MRLLLSGCALLACLALIPEARADDWPQKPVTIVVPATMGTGMDNMARLFAPRLAKRLGQPVMVENIPGASGNIGAAAVARAKPDGYTVLLSANNLVTNAALYKKVAYHPVRSFSPIALLATASLALVVHPSVPARTLPEFVKLLKTNPAQVTYASPGNGTPQHLAMELFNFSAVTEMLHVPYRGSAGAVRDLSSGEIRAMMLPLHTALPLIKSGKVIPLAVAQDERSDAAPDIPTLSEFGVRNAEVGLWYGLLAPADTPTPILERLQRELIDILETPRVKAALAKQGIYAAPDSAEKLTDLIAADRRKWGDIVQRARIRAD